MCVSSYDVLLFMPRCLSGSACRQNCHASSQVFNTSLQHVCVCVCVCQTVWNGPKIPIQVNQKFRKVHGILFSLNKLRSRPVCPWGCLTGFSMGNSTWTYCYYDHNPFATYYNWLFCKGRSNTKDLFLLLLAKSSTWHRVILVPHIHRVIRVCPWEKNPAKPANQLPNSQLS